MPISADSAPSGTTARLGGVAVPDVFVAHFVLWER
eukprot:CAMPEP_0174282876 /NCGR_PEP_ID=MMETSP0809-20121228/3462_1 /TAXON_ID=73025 ORGANISM="Eutreptiella gymnastica-like, Strain CCMP1594" /NCGR_SAMPLE_ID=MMETSP0809 /ASSEMBLY_ACC=CAM_ASM_000658 /LENGTH=34 /DNA_ID= /DNA_START= /DNA_END= /DNA_ORIENTATION=